MKENAIPKSTKDATKVGITLFKGNYIMKIVLISSQIKLQVEMSK